MTDIHTQLKGKTVFEVAAGPGDFNTETSICTNNSYTARWGEKG